MRFTYQYKTSDGERHSGVYCAASKTAVYEELKRKGIKPWGVELAPGLLNRVQSLGKRGFAIIALVGVLVAVVCYFSTRIETLEADADAPVPRHQIYGDPALMGEIEANGYAGVFKSEGDRFLARFAQPGEAVAEIRDAEIARVAPLIKDALAVDERPTEQDSREVRELKRIVRWIKDELREYLSDGEGTPERYIRRLYQRQREEVAIGVRIRRELENSKDEDKLRKANETLRKLGLRTIISGAQ